VAWEESLHCSEIVLDADTDFKIQWEEEKGAEEDIDKGHEALQNDD
jgi:hypothetical protein